MPRLTWCRLTRRRGLQATAVLWAQLTLGVLQTSRGTSSVLTQVRTTSPSWPHHQPLPTQPSLLSTHLEMLDVLHSQDVRPRGTERINVFVFHRKPLSHDPWQQAAITWYPPCKAESRDLSPISLCHVTCRLSLSLLIRAKPTPFPPNKPWVTRRPSDGSMRRADDGGAHKSKFLGVDLLRDSCSLAADAARTACTNMTHWGQSWPLYSFRGTPAVDLPYLPPLLSCLRSQMLTCVVAIHMRAFSRVIHIFTCTFRSSLLQQFHRRNMEGVPFIERQDMISNFLSVVTLCCFP